MINKYLLNHKLVKFKLFSSQIINCEKMGSFHKRKNWGKLDFCMNFSLCFLTTSEKSPPICAPLEVLPWVKGHNIRFLAVSSIYVDFATKNIHLNFFRKTNRV